MANIAKHNVPAHYLKGFTKPKTDNLWMYFLSGKPPIPTTPDSVAKEHDYWSDDTETMVTLTYEQPAQPVIDKLRERRSDFEYRERWHLGMYIVNMARRVKNEREKALVNPEQTIAEFRREFEQRLEDLIKENPEWEKEIRQSAADEIYDDAFLETVTLQAWERSLVPEYAIVNAIHVAKMKWNILIADGGQGFVTTDHPFVRTKKGLKPPDGEFLFPLTPKLALWGSWTEGAGEYYFEINADDVAYGNRWVMQWMRDFAYYPTEEDWVKRLLQEELERRSAILSSQEHSIGSAPASAGGE